jgi:hypothetical protein
VDKSRLVERIGKLSAATCDKVSDVLVEMFQK